MKKKSPKFSHRKNRGWSFYRKMKTRDLWEVARCRRKPELNYNEAGFFGSGDWLAAWRFVLHAVPFVRFPANTKSVPIFCDIGHILNWSYFIVCRLDDLGTVLAGQNTTAPTTNKTPTKPKSKMMGFFMACE